MQCRVLGGPLDIGFGFFGLGFGVGGLGAWLEQIIFGELRLGFWGAVHKLRLFFLFFCRRKRGWGGLGGLGEWQVFVGHFCVHHSHFAVGKFFARGVGEFL